MIRKFLINTGKLLLIAFMVFNLYIVISGKYWIYRAFIYNFVDIDDRNLFEQRPVHTGTPQPWPFSSGYNKVQIPAKLDSMLTLYKTVSFAVIHQDSLLYEKYWEDFSPATLSNSFSMAKSIVGILTGIALKEQKITGLEQKVSDFIPEYADENHGSLTIRHLLTMSAALDWDESYASPFSMTTEAYYGNDLRDLALRMKVVSQPGRNFEYQGGATQLLAMVIEKATQRPLSVYASEKLWGPIGAEHTAEWSLDKKDGIEKASCCFYSNARDFARLGSLYLHNGTWKGQVIVDSAYAMASVTPAPLMDNGKPNRQYGYQWWIGEFGGEEIFYCRGILGQYIVVIPSKEIVFVRMGHKRGEKNPNGELTDLPVYVAETVQWVKSRSW